MQSRDQEETINWRNINTDDMTVSYTNKYNLTNDQQRLVETLDSFFPNIVDTETSTNGRALVNNKYSTESELPFITHEMYKNLVDSKTSEMMPAPLRGGNAPTNELNDDSSSMTSSSSTSTYSSSSEKKKESKKEYKKYAKEYKKEHKQYAKASNKYAKETKKYAKESPKQNSEKLSSEEKDADYYSSSAQSGGDNSSNSLSDEAGYNNRISINTSDINMVSSTY